MGVIPPGFSGIEVKLHRTLVSVFRFLEQARRMCGAEVVRVRIRYADTEVCSFFGRTGYVYGPANKYVFSHWGCQVEQGVSMGRRKVVSLCRVLVGTGICMGRQDVCSHCLQRYEN